MTSSAIGFEVGQDRNNRQNQHLGLSIAYGPSPFPAISLRDFLIRIMIR